jgi:HSP20 family protein
MRVTYNRVKPIDRAFDDVMGTMLGTATSARSFEPAMEIRSNDQAFLLLCDLPGLKAGDVEIRILDHVLTISGARKFEAAPEEQVVLGRAYGAFEKSIRLPDDVDAEALTADMADGVLTVRLPKHEKTKPRRIAIRTKE